MKSLSSDGYIQKLEKQNADLKLIVNEQQRKIEEIVNGRINDLEELIKARDKFYRIIAHELRNPFNGILGLVELLINDFQSYTLEEIESFLKMLYRSSKITYELLISLSEWLNVQNDKMPFKPSRINISPILTEAINSAQLNAHKKKITIHNFINKDIVAYLDRHMIATVFRNLINNAIKFTDNKGTIEVTALTKNDFIEIVVKDNGIGLHEDALRKIFKQEAIHSSYGTAQEPGTGLGLLLCKEFIEIEGGKIWVESNLGQGSEFKFTLPCHMNGNR
ncbi:sensor histidine kinase [Carboxylicivirga marina]|uniref:histidine kinase n=1 Tax=Carboxylicivirga marina TaxID=2800988 RepID=A0ABS1HH69_9BACT|nr:HAMP domain-containing sensor histidine kinase [Carboxylicivirga marina]MBK3517030.1 HAMP domain-containing histidine kinase [Carboxylicivirga marina]